MKRTLVAGLALVLAAASVPAAGLVPDEPSVTENPWLDREPLVVAHQGGNHESPGNTLFALKRALATGADAFEVDLHLTRDGHVVAIHDPTVDRTTDGTGPVQERTLDQVKRLDPAYWWIPGEGSGDHDRSPDAYVYRGVATGDEPAPEGFTAGDFRIPTLDEILDALADEDVFMVLELKATSEHYRPMAHRVAELLEDHGRTDDTVMVGSFNDATTLAVKGQLPDVSSSPGLGQAGAWWASSQGPGPGTPLPQHQALQLPPTFEGVEVMSQDLVDDAHANGLAVHVWTINDRDGMNRYLDWGVEGILTDRPTVLLDVLADRAAG